MIIEYFCCFPYIIYTEPESTNILEKMLQVSDLIINIATILGGIWIISQIKKLREKRLDSTFSYLLRLQIRMKNLSSIFEQYNDFLLDCLVIPTQRKRSVDADNAYISQLISKFLNDISESLKFLMEMDDQIPIDIEWIDQYNKFIEFLETYNMLAIDSEHYYLWSDNIELQKNKFYEDHLKNMKSMISKIDIEQKSLSKKIF